jgi:hypothetical protein
MALLLATIMLFDSSNSISYIETTTEFTSLSNCQHAKSLKEDYFNELNKGQILGYSLLCVKK